MISVKYKAGTVYSYTANGFKAQKETEVYCRHEDLDKLPRDVPNGTPALIINWEELDAETKSQLKSSVRVFDAEKDIWYPVK